RVDTIPAGGFTERNNLWWRPGGGVTLGFAGATYTTVASYQAASGRGAGDRIADPLLGSDLSPASGSPTLDAGSAGVSGLAYVGDCSGSAWHFCGAEPDLGASEAPAPVVSPTSTTTTSYTTPSTPLSTLQDSHYANTVDT